ncbi:unnamed protein product [Prunus brigantina]
MIPTDIPIFGSAEHHLPPNSGDVVPSTASHDIFVCDYEIGELKLRFRLCADIPKNGCSPKRRGARGIEICSSEDSSFGSPVRSSDCFEVPNSLPNCECKSRTRSRSVNRCGLHSGSSSIHCGRSLYCVRREREGPKPFRLNRDDAGPSNSIRDDPRPSHLGHRHLHSMDKLSPDGKGKRLTQGDFGSP